MFAAPASSFAPEHKVPMASGGGTPGPSRKIALRNPMRQLPIIHSMTFRWTLAVASVFAVLVIVLFGFLYLKADPILVERSDRMIVNQLDAIAGLPSERRLDAIDDHINQDSRGV